jgi:hypothetical protein
METVMTRARPCHLSAPCRIVDEAKTLIASLNHVPIGACGPNRLTQHSPIRTGPTPRATWLPLTPNELGQV